MPTTELHLDYETASEVDLPKRGLDVYTDHPSTRIHMCAYAFDDGEVKLWDRYNDGEIMPAELAEAISDPHVRRWAFNMPFEFAVSRRIAGLRMPFGNTRCVMALAYLFSFSGRLEEIVQQMALGTQFHKDEEGKRLVKLFCGPQRITQANPHLWRTHETDPDDWEKFRSYCKQDVVAERAIKTNLVRYPIPDIEWFLYELDLRINSRGFKVDPVFSRNALAMAERRKAELLDVMKQITNLANPNSTSQLLPWLQDRGYPFSDLQKNTVKKVLFDNAQQAEQQIRTWEPNDEAETVEIEFAEFDMSRMGFLTPAAQRVLTLRQQASRTSTRKHKTLLERVGNNDRNRFALQFAGASGTARWSGRAFQPQNLASTPPELENEAVLDVATQIIREGDYEMLQLLVEEPMNALAGTVRSTIITEEDKHFVVADLSSIETCVIGWVSGCERLLNVFRTGKDAYKDFATMLFSKAYEDVTKDERKKSKPAVLGSGFRLGGGEMRAGKKTGLWGYAENMGIVLTQAEALRMTNIFRKEAYPEIPKLWYALEAAVERAMRSPGAEITPTIRRNDGNFDVPVTFKRVGPFLTMKLPSGRRLYYFQPRLEEKVFYPADGGEPYTRINLTYMRKDQVTKQWKRRESHGGLLTENLVQALARDILATGMRRATAFGFDIVLHVHDEIVAEVADKDSDRLSLAALKKCMSDPISWVPGLPLGAAGWVGTYYKKD